jgi:hypothetical protein
MAIYLSTLTKISFVFPTIEISFLAVQFDCLMPDDFRNFLIVMSKADGWICLIASKPKLRRQTFNWGMEFASKKKSSSKTSEPVSNNGWLIVESGA